MKYRALGRTGWKVSEISFGAWAIGGAWGQVSDEESMAALHKAIDRGVNFIDTADVYGDGRSERLIARLRKERKRGDHRRHQGRPAPAAADGRGLQPGKPFGVDRRKPAESIHRQRSTWSSCTARRPRCMTGLRSLECSTIWCGPGKFATTGSASKKWKRR